MNTINSSRYSAKELLLTEHCFHISKDITCKLKAYYLKVWNKDYLQTKLDYSEGNPIIWDGDIEFKVRSTLSRKEIDRSIHKQFGLSFRVIDNSHAYVIIKPWHGNKVKG